MDWRTKISDLISSVPVRLKIAGIMVLPVLILGLALNYWIRTGLSDWLSYLLTDERVHIAMQNGSRSVVIVTMMAAIISVMLTFFLMLILTRPLLHLRQVALNVADGDFSLRAKIWAQDEIGEVAQAVNHMIDRLVVGQQKLQRTNRRLEAVNKVIMAASRALDLREVLDAALQATLDVMRLESGWVLLCDSADPDNQPLRLVSQIGLESNWTDVLKGGQQQLCACRSDLLSGQLGQNASLRSCPCFYKLNPDSKPVEHITIPLGVRDQWFGVINLVCPQNRSLSEDDLDILTTIGVHLSVIAANAQLHASLVEKEAVRQALLEALVRAQEDERARLARELHDGTGQTLTSLLVRLKVLEKQQKDAQLRENVSELCEATSGIIEQVRGVSYRLRPSALEEFGLDMALRSLVQDMTEPAEIGVDFNLSLGKQRLPFEIESTLYRIAQECLTNVLRHAQASHVTVELLPLPYAICLRVEDDGIGFDPNDLGNGKKRPRLGLIGLQERAEMLGGSLVVQSAPGAGTSVQVRIPLEMEITA
ncbi:MAG: HAMP domain-containing protein [Chloroflexi bacterium]|nr:MAG: HAMP domain-containing protein [Chloroflexota bacterium]